jgi:hypothetical protein
MAGHPGGKSYLLEGVRTIQPGLTTMIRGHGSTTWPRQIDHICLASSRVRSINS